MMGGSNRMGGFIGSALGGAFLAIGGFTAVGVFCLATVAISALVIRLAVHEPEAAE